MGEHRISLGFNFTESQKARLLSEIEGFYLDVFDEEISDLHQEQLLDFIAESAAPIIYNKALDDVSDWHKAQAENLAIDFTMLYRDID